MKKPRAKRVKKPKHAGEVRAWKFAFRLGQDTGALHAALETAWRLRNDIAGARIENGREIRAAKLAGTVPPARLIKRDQEMWLAEQRRLDASRAGRLHSLVVKNIADRIDEGWKRFWEAFAAGRKDIKPPRPIKKERYRSLTYPQYGNGVRISDGRVHLSMLGSYRLHLHRKVLGKIQTVSVKFADGRWWCIVTSRVAASRLYSAPAPDAIDVGADPGLSAIVTFSDGRSLDPPRALADKLSRLRLAQKDLSRKFEAQKSRQAEEARRAKLEGRPAERLPLSNRLRKQIVEVGKIHTKVTNIRSHWHKLGARRTEQRYARVAWEDHGVNFMIRNRRLARSASDRAISAQKMAMASALGPRLVLTANQRPGIGGNSQTCLCGAEVRKTLSERWHKCPGCGLAAPRDVVSANIVEMIAFGTHKLTTAPGRGSLDVEETSVRSRESASATVPSGAVRVSVVISDRDTQGSVDLKLHEVCENTAGGHGLPRKARTDVINLPLLAHELKPTDKKLRKRPALAG